MVPMMIVFALPICLFLLISMVEIPLLMDDNLIVWFRDNVTALCTAECSETLSTWLSDVEAQCAGDRINIDDHLIEPYTIPLKYIAGFDMACLQDRYDCLCFKFVSQF